MIDRRWVGALAACALTGLAAPAAAAPLLSEVFYDQTGSDDGEGFVELWGPPGLALDGYVLDAIPEGLGAPGVREDQSEHVCETTGHPPRVHGISESPAYLCRKTIRPLLRS